ncbi:FtsB family cell division protein [Halothiobacillus neapolitanus]|jgi:cell division protein FtsB|uniref:Cell division protein FtsB n=1 Tax=Halothiobacillus neapolitanus (strain ATCC 23641 / DSM 15147 / CIP 104769 / NCIMB 8539 / c2) TaxID=555778 RepID=D0KYJ4_HALNC|nr:septum formation initiator family protein [Halothiobacillus neapolitanus]ACX95517.1 Septum formation initiator [Halothiobacillus neapolitanus c2]TDN65814.1 cell division protein FtsB [Halothiobacillus neapolitanus]
MTRTIRLSLLVGLLIILGSLQWRLWFGGSSLRELWQKQARLSEMIQTQDALTERNRRLFAEVDDLKTGLGVVEALARLDLGMIGPNETFYQVIEDAQTDQITPNAPTAPQTSSVNPEPTPSAISTGSGQGTPQQRSTP